MYGHEQGRWFQVRLLDYEGLLWSARRLRQAIWPAGHDTGLAVDEEGQEFVAAFIRAPRPSRELERLMRNAGLEGTCLALPWAPTGVRLV
jgi:hypothetical protein